MCSLWTTLGSRHHLSFSEKLESSIFIKCLKFNSKIWITSQINLLIELFLAMSSSTVNAFRRQTFSNLFCTSGGKAWRFTDVMIFFSQAPGWVVHNFAPGVSLFPHKTQDFCAGIEAWVFSRPVRSQIRSQHGQQERGCPPKDHNGMRWLQRTQLHYKEESPQRSRSYGAKEVLPTLQGINSSPRNSLISNQLWLEFESV